MPGAPASVCSTEPSGSARSTAPSGSASVTALVPGTAPESLSAPGRAWVTEPAWVSPPTGPAPASALRVSAPLPVTASPSLPARAEATFGVTAESWPVVAAVWSTGAVSELAFSFASGSWWATMLPAASAEAGTPAATVAAPVVPAAWPSWCVVCCRVEPVSVLVSWPSGAARSLLGSRASPPRADAEPAATSGVAPAATTSAAWAIRRVRG